MGSVSTLILYIIFFQLSKTVHFFITEVTNHLVCPGCELLASFRWHVGICAYVILDLFLGVYYNYLPHNCTPCGSTKVCWHVGSLSKWTIHLYKTNVVKLIKKTNDLQSWPQNQDVPDYWPSNLFTHLFTLTSTKVLIKILYDM